MTETGTMPQGAAASPDGKTLAVVESGFNPPTLGLYRTDDLKQLGSITLKGAFGRPVWLDARHVLVAGANADALLDVDLSTRTVHTIAMPKQSYPTAVATLNGRIFALATDGDASVRIGTLQDLPKAKPVRVGGHIGGLAFAPDGKTLFASNRASDYVAAIDTATLAERRIPTGLHPSDLLVDGQHTLRRGERRRFGRRVRRRERKAARRDFRRRSHGGRTACGSLPQCARHQRRHDLRKPWRGQLDRHHSRSASCRAHSRRLVSDRRRAGRRPPPYRRRQRRRDAPESLPLSRLGELPRLRRRDRVRIDPRLRSFHAAGRPRSAARRARLAAIASRYRRE